MSGISQLWRKKPKTHARRKLLPDRTTLVSREHDLHPNWGRRASIFLVCSKKFQKGVFPHSIPGNKKNCVTRYYFFTKIILSLCNHAQICKI